MSAALAMPNVKHSSASAEHMTPYAIVDAAREVLEVIELDPATSEFANRHIKARRYYTKADNGLCARWRGRVFLNPPGGLCDRDGVPVYRKNRATGERGCTVSGSCGLAPGHGHEAVTSQAKAWWTKLARAWAVHDVECALFVGFSIEILQTAQALPGAFPEPLDFPFCVPAKRLEFLTEGPAGRPLPGEQPTHASVLVYLPPRWDAAGKRFAERFSPFGRVRL